MVRQEIELLQHGSGWIYWEREREREVYFQKWYSTKLKFHSLQIQCWSRGKIHYFVPLSLAGIMPKVDKQEYCLSPSSFLYCRVEQPLHKGNSWVLMPLSSRCCYFKSFSMSCVHGTGDIVQWENISHVIILQARLCKFKAELGSSVKQCVQPSHI